MLIAFFHIGHRNFKVAPAIRYSLKITFSTNCSFKHLKNGMEILRVNKEMGQQACKYFHILTAVHTLLLF